jgi:hypothetical protein
MFKHVRRVLIATVPVTLTVLALTAGGASALPRSCASLAEDVNEYYGDYQYWNDMWNEDYGVKPLDQVLDEAGVAQGYYQEYQRSLAEAANFGCF